MGEHVIVTELIAKIEAYLTKSSDDPIARARWSAVCAHGHAIKFGGYPTRDRPFRDLSARVRQRRKGVSVRVLPPRPRGRYH